MECDVQFCKGISHQMAENISVEVMLKKVTRVRHSKEGFQGKTQRTKTKKIQSCNSIGSFLKFKNQNNFNNNYC